MRLSDFFGISGKKNETEAGRPITGDHSSGDRIGRQIRALTPGQTIHGEIISRNGNEVQIRLSGDLVLNARLDQAMNLELGRGMTFEVKNNGASLTLSPLFANTATDASVLKALTQASLPVNASTVEMTQLMMKAGMSIGKESLSSLFREAGMFPEAQIRDIVDLHALGLPVNEANLAQMASYRNLTHQLVAGMNDILDGLPQLLQDMLQSGDAGQAAGLFSELFMLASEAGFGENPGNVPGGGFIAGAEGAGAEGGSAALAAGNAAGSEQALAAGNAAGSEQALTAGNGTGMEQAKAPGLEADRSGPAGGQAALDAEALAGKADPTLRAQQDAAAGTGPAGGEDAAVGDRAGAAPLRELLNAMELPEQARSRFSARLELLQNGRLGTQDTLLLAGELLRQAAETAGQRFAETGALERALRGFIQNKEWGQLLRGALQENWTLQPAQLREEGRLTELYNRLDRQLGRLSQALENAGQAQSGVMRSAAAMTQNLDFLQQLNQMYTYVQLPLKMSGSAAHGDLYVYTNKKRLTERGGSVSALLHLDMEHLGPLDVYVAMQSGKVSTHFYVRDEEMLDFLGEHMDLLTGRLKERGYDVKCGMQIREKGGAGKEQPALRELVEAGAPAVPLAQYSFDVRA